MANNEEVAGGCLGCILYVTILGLVVCSCVSLGYGIKFLVTDFNIFHEKGDCDGSELWNVLVGSVATGTLDVTSCITIITSTIVSIMGLTLICAEEIGEQAGKMCNYYCGCAVSLAYSLTFAILIGNEYDKLDGCAKVRNSNLGEFSNVKYYLHLTNSCAILLSVASLFVALILRCVMFSCFSGYVTAKQQIKEKSQKNVTETNSDQV